MYYYNNSRNEFFSGQRIAFATAVGTAISFRFLNAQSVTVQDVVNNASGFMGLWSGGIENLTLRNYRSVPGDGRLLSSTRDAVHLSGYSKGTLRIENSKFARSGDDAIHYTSRTSDGIKTSCTATDTGCTGPGDLPDTKVWIKSPQIVEVNDVVEIYDVLTRARRGTATVKKVNGNVVEFVTPIAGMQNGDLFLDTAAVFDQVTIRGNRFENHRGRGILPDGPGLITGNTFVDVPQAMRITTVATKGGEGPIANHVRVENNIFENVFQRPVTEIGGDIVPTATDESAENFRIIGNHFLGVTTPIVRAELGRDIVVSGNDAVVTSATPVNLVEVGRSLNKANGVTVTGLTVHDTTGISVRTPVSILAGSRNVNVGTITGDFTAPEYINNTGAAPIYRGSSTTQALGAPGENHHLWDFDTSLDGWTAGFNATVSAPGDVLEYRLSGPDARIVSALDLTLDAGRLRYVKIGLRNATTGTYGQVYFRTAADPTWTESKKVTFTVRPTTAGFVEYVADLATVPSWTGTAIQLRIDPPDQAASGDDGIVDGAIDYVLLSPDPRLSGAVRWDTDAELATLTRNYMSSPQISDGKLTYDVTDTQEAAPRLTTPDVGELGLGLARLGTVEVKIKNPTIGTNVAVFHTTKEYPVQDAERRASLQVATLTSGYATFYVDLTTGSWTPTETLAKIRVDLPRVPGVASTDHGVESIAVVGDLTLLAARANH
ncbi:hypothetical protein EV137_0715 [Kribbella pratensis]|uniref:Right handed beta helix domain-containing protein n=1 Tax=Kribbella pratensis TaxID=2512112 RepID=A0ABY2FJY0_9ACTN|nr:hypothetical protein EV137_0715 [Kribbella pratensis]